MEKFDCIIIGSGMGGLASAVILAKEGHQVCVLEQNNQFGGNLQTFVRNKKILDTGVHYLGSLDKDQLLYKYFSYLGIIEDLALERMDMDAFDVISFEKEANCYPIAQGYENFKRQLLNYFPEEEATLTKYITDIRSVCQQFPLYNLEAGSIYDTTVLEINLREYIENLTPNNTLQSVLVGTNFLYAGNSETTPFYVHALTVNSYIESAWKCFRGGSQITKALVKQLRKYGGTIYRRKEVIAVDSEENIIKSVQTQDGAVYYADKFISNIDLTATIQLVGHSNLRKSFCRRIEKLTPTPSSFSVHIILKPCSIKYKVQNRYHFMKEEQVWTAANATENWPQMFMISLTKDQKNSTYAESMSVLTYMNFADFTEWSSTNNSVATPGERGEEYEKFKQAKTEELIESVKKIYPEIRNAIHATYASTPLTYRDYIGSKNGGMYGFEKDAKHPLQTLFSPKTTIRNLFLTGQCINMHGVLGVTIGAVNTCAEFIDRKLLIQKIKNA